MVAPERALVDPWLGKTLDDHYRLEQPLGTNATCCVYRARDRERRRSVAVMMLHERLAGRSGVLESFMEAARAVSRIRHANIVKMEDLGRAGSTAYLVAEWMPGPTLEHWARSQGPLTWVRARPIAIQITEALLAMHRRKAVHGALRLQSCFVGEGEASLPKIKVGGFGFTSIRQADEPGIVGSEAADVQAIGEILVRLLTREGLVMGGRDEIRSRPLPGLPDAVVSVIRRALSEDEHVRFDGAQSLLTALEDPIAHAARGVVAGSAVAAKARPVQTSVAASSLPVPMPSSTSWPSPHFASLPPEPSQDPHIAPPMPSVVPPRAVSLSAWMARHVPPPSALPPIDPGPPATAMHSREPVPTAPPLVPPPTTVLAVEELRGAGATTVFDRHALRSPPTRTTPLPFATRGPEGTIELDPNVLAAARGEEIEPTALVVSARVGAASILGSQLEPTRALDRDELRAASPLPRPWGAAATVELTAFLPNVDHLTPTRTHVTPASTPTPLPAPACVVTPVLAPTTAAIRGASPRNLTALVVVATVIAVAVGAAVGLIIARSPTGRAHDTPAPQSPRKPAAESNAANGAR